MEADFEEGSGVLSAEVCGRKKSLVDTETDKVVSRNWREASKPQKSIWRIHAMSSQSLSKGHGGNWEAQRISPDLGALPLPGKLRLRRASRKSLRMLTRLSRDQTSIEANKGCQKDWATKVADKSALNLVIRSKKRNSNANHDHPPLSSGQGDIALKETMPQAWKSSG